MGEFWRPFRKTKSVALFDIDGTSYSGFFAKAIVDAEAKAGLIPQVTQQAVQEAFDAYKAKKIDYSQMATVVLNEWSQGLIGQRVRRVRRHAKQVIQQHENAFSPFVTQTRDYLRRSHDPYFVTAEPQFVAQPVKEVYRFRGEISTVFEVRRGRFTGKIERTLGGNYKKNAIEHITYNKFNTVAFGDSSGDEGMLETVTHPIVIADKGKIDDPDLERTVAQTHWPVVSPEHAFALVKKIFPQRKSKHL